MIKAKNIAKTLTLMALLLLLVGLRYAFAQNDGRNPYINSVHTYRITVGNPIANTHEWVLADATHAKIKTLTLADNIVVSIDAATSAGDNEDITLKFRDDYASFVAGTSLYLQYFEYVEYEGGSKICIAAREIPITILANSFYFGLTAEASDCNEQSGLLHTYESMDDEKFTNTIDYTLTMHREANLLMANWSFDVDFDLDDAAFTFDSYTITTDAGGGNVSALADVGGGYGTALDGLFGVTIAPPTDPTDVEVVVTIRVVVRGEAWKEVGVTLNILNGKATSGASPPAITNDNVLNHPGRVQLVELWAIPLTSNITAN